MVFGQCYKANSYTILLQLSMRSAATSQMTLKKRKGCLSLQRQSSLPHAAILLIKKPCAPKIWVWSRMLR